MSVLKLNKTWKKQNRRVYPDCLENGAFKSKIVGWQIKHGYLLVFHLESH